MTAEAISTIGGCAGVGMRSAEMDGWHWCSSMLCGSQLACAAVRAAARRGWPTPGPRNIALAYYSRRSRSSPPITHAEAVIAVCALTHIHHVHNHQAWRWRSPPACGLSTSCCWPPPAISQRPWPRAWASPCSAWCRRTLLRPATWGQWRQRRRSGRCRRSWWVLLLLGEGQLGASRHGVRVCLWRGGGGEGGGLGGVGAAGGWGASRAGAASGGLFVWARCLFMWWGVHSRRSGPASWSPPTVRIITA